MKSVAKTKKACSIAILQQSTGMLLTQKFNNLTQYKYTSSTNIKSYINHANYSSKRDEQSFSKQNNSSHGNIRHYSTTPIVVSSEEIDTSESIIQLDPLEYKSWTKEQVCSLLCAKEKFGAGLAIEDVKPLYDAGFKGTSLASIVLGIQNKKDPVEETHKEFPSVSRSIIRIVVFWVENLLLPKKQKKQKKKTKQIYKPERGLISVTIQNFDITAHVHSLLHTKLLNDYQKSIMEWNNKTQIAEQYQKSILKSLYRTPLLPDHINSFDNSRFQNWSYHLSTGLRIPEDKGKELNILLCENTPVGRGDEFHFGIIPVIDLSTSGKTFTVYQLASTQPSTQYSSFFVLHIVEGRKFLNKLLINIKENNLRTEKLSTEKLVSLFSLTALILIKTLVEKMGKIDPLDFLKFTKNRGDELLSEILETLIKCNNQQEDKLITICTNITKWLQGKGIKVVFAFDEAHTLLKHAINTVELDGKMEGNLFHAIYKTIRQFNNPVLLGTSFSISNAVLNVSKEGRKLLSNPIIGCMEPWFIDEVDIILGRLFNIDTIKQSNPEEYYMLCYLLSGSPENVTRLHRALLTNPNTINEEDPMLTLENGLQLVIQNNQDLTITRLEKFLITPPEPIMDRITHLLRLLFGKECTFIEPKIEEFDTTTTQGTGIPSYSIAFIEKTIAHVTQIGKQKSFEIVDPISAKTYFKQIISNYPSKLWNFMATEFTNSAEEFELFMIVLLIQESLRLQNTINDSQSPLFPNSSLLNEWKINVTTFISDKSLLKKKLQYNKNITGIWFGQLAFKHFLDTFVKPDHKMGPDGIFYLKKKDFDDIKPVLCAMSLVDDPITHNQQPNKAASMLRTISLSNIGKDKSGAIGNLGYDLSQHLPNFTKQSTIGWIIAPNMDATAFPQNNDSLIITTAIDITNCIECHQHQPYYESMKKVWSKFQ